MRDSSVCDDWYLVANCFPGIIYGGQLRHAHTGHHAGCAYGAWAYAHLDGVRSGLIKRLGSFLGAYITGHHIDLRVFILQVLEGFEHASAMSVRRVQDEGVHIGVHQGLDALLVIGSHGGGHAQAMLAVPVEIRLDIVAQCAHIMKAVQSAEAFVPVNQRQLPDPVLQHDIEGLLDIGVWRSGDQVFGHDLADRHIEAGQKLHVASGEQAHQALLVIKYGKAVEGIVVPAFFSEQFGEQHILSENHRLADNAVEILLDLGSLLGLLGHTQVLVNDA